MKRSELRSKSPEVNNLYPFLYESHSSRGENEYYLQTEYGGAFYEIILKRIFRVERSFVFENQRQVVY